MSFRARKPLTRQIVILVTLFTRRFVFNVMCWDRMDLFLRRGKSMIDLRELSTKELEAVSGGEPASGCSGATVISNQNVAGGMLAVGMINCNGVPMAYVSYVPYK